MVQSDWLRYPLYLFVISINQLVHGLLQILPSDWLSYSLSIGDRHAQVAKIK